MAKDLLIEIGMEEIPARFIRGAVEQFADKVSKWLGEARISHEEVRSYATPRRIAVLVKGAAEKQDDLNEEVKGPSRKIALDDQGQWSKAALGFARTQGVDPERLFFKELGGVEYVYAAKSSVGIETKAVLPEAITHIITSMTFPKNMRWGGYDLKFVRPIRWIVALFGAEVLPIEIAGVKSGNVTRGHRFLGGEAVVHSPEQYVETLRSQFVYADIEERKRLIEEQIRQMAEEKGWHIAVKEDLLEEVLFLVEYPTALYGTFDPDFLHIPQEVLITSMREHQRYFPVLNAEGALLPYFVTVRNGNSVAIEQVARGNEKVLRARLSDARFFYQEDQKLTISSALERLETIVFHEDLGTIGDKVRRIVQIADELARAASCSAEQAADVTRAAEICKFDLVTQMVYEFPELQGVMGEDYARKAGEREQVAKAVFEHYQPRFAGDSVPASLVGALVGIADKLDTITGCFSIGIIPTGSQDPYALRRLAAGIVQILLDRQLPLTLSRLFDTALAVHEKAGLLKRDATGIRSDLYDFFALRVKNVLSESARYDIVDAAMGGGFDDVASAVRRGAALMRAVQSQSDFKTTVESFNRVSNLAAKATGAAVDPSLFEDASEHGLYEAHRSKHTEFAELMVSGREEGALQALSALKDAITVYFDKVMIMVDDERVRANRLGLLASIYDDLRNFADFQKIVFETISR